MNFWGACPHCHGMESNRQVPDSNTLDGVEVICAGCFRHNPATRMTEGYGLQSISVPDVYFREPYLENNFGPTPILIRSRQHKAALMKQLGLREAGDRGQSRTRQAILHERRTQALHHAIEKTLQTAKSHVGTQTHGEVLR